MTDAVDLDGLVPAIAAGDPDAFALWVASNELALRLSLKSFAADVDTEAVIQEALLRVWQVAPRFQADGRPHGLLRLSVRIARNLCIDHVRRNRTVAMEEPAQLAEALPPPDPLLRKAIRLCMEQLPKKPAAALMARLQSDGTAPDQALCKTLGMQLNTFLQNVTRARRALADCLGKRGVELSQ